jgi:hypothetical protein
MSDLLYRGFSIKTEAIPFYVFSIDGVENDSVFISDKEAVDSAKLLIDEWLE